ncbi:MAG: outer membrane lipoprotein-sorting protein [Victivallaceae bacterium]|nr:outer membrane lipoprotein-sorting protein [Victivallaceae bacterium]
MKKLLLMTAVATLFVSAGCNCPCGFSGKKEKAESIVAKMQKAVDVSGKQNKTTSAVIVYDSHLGKKKNSRITLKLKKSGKIRLEVRRENSLMIRACNGKVGWEYITGKGLRFLKAAELNELKFQAAYLAPNVKFDKLFPNIKLDGSKEAAGVDCWKLVCTPDAKFKLAPVIMLVDKNNYLVIKTIEEYKKAGKVIKIATYFGDYEDYDGIMTPFMMVSQVDGKLLESKLVSVKWNAKIADIEFATPKTLSKAK